jgi:hypothetical protein
MTAWLPSVPRSCARTTTLRADASLSRHTAHHTRNQPTNQPTQVLLYAQLRGNNQGIIKITTGGLNKSAAAAPMAVERESRLSALINGNGQAGMLVLGRAMGLAVDKARAAGFGIVGTHHTSTSTGALGYYADAIAREGLIGLVLAQSPEFVAPHGARSALFGTNPIAIGVPAESGPVVMDMATAAYAWFGLLEAQTAGRPIPGDVALNAAGQPTTDPSEVLSGGAIRVFDRWVQWGEVCGGGGLLDVSALDTACGVVRCGLVKPPLPQHATALNIHSRTHAPHQPNPNQPSLTHHTPMHMHTTTPGATRAATWR